MNDETLVIFRKWRDTSDVIALFPAIPSDIEGFHCLSFEQLDQHGGADYHGVIQATQPASDEESASLAGELSRIGYRLRPIKRTAYQVHESRRGAAKAMKAAAI